MGFRKSKLKHTNKPLQGHFKNDSGSFFKFLAEFNKVPNLLQDVKLGIVNKPLDEYITEFESGLIDGGEYVSGQITEDADTVSIIDSSTYSPLTDQDTVVDADLYINI